MDNGQKRQIPFTVNLREYNALIGVLRFLRSGHYRFIKEDIQKGIILEEWHLGAVFDEIIQGKYTPPTTNAMKPNKKIIEKAQMYRPPLV